MQQTQGTPDTLATLRQAPDTGAPVVARPASILMLVRDSAAGMEVFMMQRTRAADFVPGANVFPGGAVDDIDGHVSMLEHCSGVDDTWASQILGIERNGLSYWIGAVRECFEESGLLFATGPDGAYVDLNEPQNSARFGELRRQLNAGELSFGEMCRQSGVRIAVDKMTYFSHWITPVGISRRYDTRFFLAVAPPSQTASHDDNETVANVWIRPQDALDQNEKGEFTLVYATKVTLQELACYDSVDELMAHAHSQREIITMLPRIAFGKAGRRPLSPRDPAYPEVGKIDPLGKGIASYEIEQGKLVQLAPKVWRITAPNPGYMTGPGTNTYLLGDEQGVTVIDPGPADESHVKALLEHTPGPIRQIVVTHTHSDHSPAARLLKAQTGAVVMGWPAPPVMHQDKDFSPDHQPAHGERIETRAGSLRVIHTPGHTSNHLCYLLEDEKMLFTGDHIMQGSTVVISPPDGNMRVYLDSLRMLLDEDIEFLAPAHGFLIDKPARAITELIEHRLRRESLILRALFSHGPTTPEVLLTKVYSSLPEPLKPVAFRSLNAHLIKLQSEGTVAFDGELWRALKEL